MSDVVGLERTQVLSCESALLETSARRGEPSAEVSKLREQAHTPIMLRVVLQSPARTAVSSHEQEEERAP